MPCLRMLTNDELVPQARRGLAVTGHRSQAGESMKIESRKDVLFGAKPGVVTVYSNFHRSPFNVLPISFLTSRCLPFFPSRR